MRHKNYSSQQEIIILVEHHPKRVTCLELNGICVRDGHLRRLIQPPAKIQRWQFGIPAVDTLTISRLRNAPRYDLDRNDFCVKPMLATRVVCDFKVNVIEEVH